MGSTGGSVSPSAGTASSGTDSGTPASGGGGTSAAPSPDASGGDGVGSSVIEPTAGAPDGGSGAAPVTDDCPSDPDKLSPGACGCGVPEKATSAMSDCRTLVAKLIHRYDFEGTGTVVKDRVGTADGTVKAATLSTMNGKGVVLLGGGSSGPYVDLPNKLLSTLTSATLEAWITWGGGNDWQRIFDFGDSNAASPENNPAGGKSYLFLTPRADSKLASAVFSTDGWTNEVRVPGTAALSMSMAHVAVVADASGDKLKLYIDGKKSGEGAWTGTLASINDVNVWLGRSQYDTDPEFSGVFHEFRIYGAALSDADVAASFAGGPDPVFLAY